MGPSRALEISNATVLLLALGYPRLSQAGVQTQRRSQLLPRLVAQSNGWLNVRRVVAARIDVCKQGPGKRELRIQPHRFSQVFLCAQIVGRCVLRFQGISQTA